MRDNRASDGADGLPDGGTPTGVRPGSASPPRKSGPLPYLAASVSGVTLGFAGFLAGWDVLTRLPQGGDVGSIKILLVPLPFLLAAGLAAAAFTGVLIAGRRWAGPASAGSLGLATILLWGLLPDCGRWAAPSRDPAPARGAASGRRDAPGPPVRAGARPRGGEPVPADEPIRPRAPPGMDEVRSGLAPGASPAAAARALDLLARSPDLADETLRVGGEPARRLRVSVEEAVRSREAGGSPTARALARRVRDGFLLRERVRREGLGAVLDGLDGVGTQRALMAGVSSQGWLDPWRDEQGRLRESDLRALEAWARRCQRSGDPDLAFEARVLLDDWIPRQRGEDPDGG